MMKKEYVKPGILVEEILLEGLLAQSLEITPDPVRPASNDREEGRTWGNLWD